MVQPPSLQPPVLRGKRFWWSTRTGRTGRWARSWGEEQEEFEEIVIEEEASPAAGGLADSEEFAVDLGTGGELLVSSSSRRGLPTFDNSASSGAHFSVQSADTFPWRLPLPPPEDPPPSEPVGTPELWVSSESESEAPVVAPPSRISRPSKSRKSVATSPRPFPRPDASGAGGSLLVSRCNC